MKYTYYILFALLFMSSCSEYQKVYRGKDVKEKFTYAEKLYNEGEYKKAQVLFVQIVPGYRGKPGAEKLMYMYANTFYERGDWATAGYQAERFTKAYPRSQKLDEMAFKAAKSSFMLAPRETIDQTETNRALLKLQNFMTSYPKSVHFKEASALANELDYKLQKKSYLIAKGYHHRISSGTQFRDDYYAAISAFDNFLSQYPGSKFQEEAYYYKFDAAYLLAVNSTDRRKEERIEKAITYYNKFSYKFPESKFSDDATSRFERLNKHKQKLQ